MKLNRAVGALGLFLIYCMAVYRATCWLLWCGWVYLLWSPKPLRFSFHLLSHTLPEAALLLAAIRVTVKALMRMSEHWGERHV